MTGGRECVRGGFVPTDKDIRLNHSLLLETPKHIHTILMIKIARSKSFQIIPIVIIPQHYRSFLGHAENVILFLKRFLLLIQGKSSETNLNASYTSIKNEKNVRLFMTKND